MAKGKPTWMKGKNHTERAKEKMRLADRSKTTGINNVSWKGNKVGYFGLHAWVNRFLGKPGTCELCGKSGLKGSRINWANSNGQYKRNLTDWLRLCIPCHRKYDAKNNYSRRMVK